MRLILQRVHAATAYRDEQAVAKIGRGCVVFTGFREGDDHQITTRMARKLINARIFESGSSTFGASVLEVGGNILTISQFTVYADFSRGRRPNMSRNLSTADAEKLYAAFGDELKTLGACVVQTPFQSRLRVDVTNWGPFTSLLDSAELWPSSV